MDLELHGSGRHPATKQIRAIARHPKRCFWLGGLFIKPKVRYTVTSSWCAAHLTELTKHIRAGNIMVKHAQDGFVDPEELRVLCFGTAADVEAMIAKSAEEAAALGTERAAATAAAIAVLEAEALAQAQKQVTEETEQDTVEEPVVSEPPALPLPEEAVVAESAVVAEEPASEVAAEAPVVETPVVVAVEQAPVVVEEPVVVAAPAAPAVAKPAALVEGWQDGNKRSLLKLAEERGLDVSAMPSNKKLVEMILTVGY